ncbi:MAG: glycoside hydrolase family 88 protein [Cyclobacteriaceae bacterium]
MKNFITFLPLVFCISIACSNRSGKDQVENQDSEPPLYVWMADSEMKRNPDPRLLDFRDSPKWEYSNGLVCLAMLKAWEKSGNQRFFDYAKYYADSMILEDGSILTYKLTDYNIDRVNPGKMLIELYKETGIARYRKALDTLRKQMKEHPRTSEGGFWHKKIYPHQMWLDGLYMGSPFLAQFAKEYNEPALFDDVALQIQLMDKYAWDSEKELYYHGWDESRDQRWADPETGLSPHCWGRAMGWYAMALVDVLDFMPEEHPERPEILKILKKMASSITKYQDEDSGVWWQIIDMGGKEGNYLEASCSSMFTYFLYKSVDKGYLATDYLQHAEKGFNGIKKNFIKQNEDGTISLTNVCGVAGLGGDPYRDASYEYYVNEIIRDNDPKGVGPFIMAAIYNEQY